MLHIQIHFDAADPQEALAILAQARTRLLQRMTDPVGDTALYWGTGNDTTAVGYLTIEENAR